MSDTGELRVLHVAESMGTGVLQVVRTVAERHHSVGVRTAIAYGVRPETPSDLADTIPSGIDLFPLPWARRLPQHQLAALRALRAVLDSYRPTVVHLHSSFAGAVGLAAVKGSVPTVLSPHAFAFTMENLSPLTQAIVRRLEGALVQRCSVVGAVSWTEAEQARGALGASRVTVVENGIPELDDARLRTRSVRDSGRPKVVAAGRIGPQRQPHLVAEILDGVRDIADVEWVGAAPPGTGYDTPLRERSIPITGWVTREETMKALETADVYLHYSAWDGQAISLLEALAQDAAIVASDIPASREVLPSGSLAAKPAAAVARIRSLIQDPSERADQHDAQHAVRTRYAADRMAARWLDVYRELAFRTNATPRHSPHA